MKKIFCSISFSRIWLTLCLIGLLGSAASSAMAQTSDSDMDQMAKNSRANGMLAKVLYVVFTQGIPGAALPEGINREQMMTIHLDYQKKLEKEGIMFGAGPFSAEGIAAQGMIVIRADSMEQAKAIADADPMHRLGQRKYTLGRWQINEGTVSIRVNFSNGTYEFE